MKIWHGKVCYNQECIISLCSVGILALRLQVKNTITNDVESESRIAWIASRLI
jgi:hypothetical protein